MSTYENLIIENKEVAGGTIQIVTINRPQALNALNESVLSDLLRAMQDVDKNKSIKAVILTGSGEKAFVAGADIKTFESMGQMQAVLFAEKGQKVFRMLEIMKVPVIAAVNGFALGGGCELALACDFIIASEKAKFGLPEVTLGLIPGFGGTQRLSRFVGVGVARELTYTGRMINATEAHNYGLANRVVAPEALMATCLEIAGQILQRAPRAIEKAKMAINHGADLPIDEGLHFERENFGELFVTSDVKEGVRAFIEKRQPQFKGE